MSDDQTPIRKTKEMVDDSTTGYPTQLAASYTLVLLWGVYVSNQ